MPPALQIAKEYGIEQSDMLLLNPDFDIGSDGSYSAGNLTVPCKQTEGEPTESLLSLLLLAVVCYICTALSVVQVRWLGYNIVASQAVSWCIRHQYEGSS